MKEKIIKSFKLSDGSEIDLWDDGGISIDQGYENYVSFEKYALIELVEELQKLI